MSNDEQSLFYTQYMIRHPVFARYLIMLQKEKLDHIQILIGLQGKSEGEIHKTIAHETVHALCTIPGNPITRPFWNSEHEEALCDYYATLARMRMQPGWNPSKSPIEVGLFRGSGQKRPGSIDGLVILVQSNGLTTAHLGEPRC